jgi:hypothetical protein
VLLKELFETDKLEHLVLDLIQRRLDAGDSISISRQRAKLSGQLKGIDRDFEDDPLNIGVFTPTVLFLLEATTSSHSPFHRFTFDVPLAEVEDRVLLSPSKDPAFKWAVTILPRKTK